MLLLSTFSRAAWLLPKCETCIFLGIGSQQYSASLLSSSLWSWGYGLVLWWWDMNESNGSSWLGVKGWLITEPSISLVLGIGVWLFISWMNLTDWLFWPIFLPVKWEQNHLIYFKKLLWELNGFFKNTVNTVGHVTQCINHSSAVKWILSQIWTWALHICKIIYSSFVFGCSYTNSKSVAD